MIVGLGDLCSSPCHRHQPAPDCRPQYLHFHGENGDSDDPAYVGAYGGILLDTYPEPTSAVIDICRSVVLPSYKALSEKLPTLRGPTF